MDPIVAKGDAGPIGTWRNVMGTSASDGPPFLSSVIALTLAVLGPACGGSNPGYAGDGGASGQGDAATPRDAAAAALSIVVDNSAAMGPATHLSVGCNQIYAVDTTTPATPTAQARLTALAPNLLRLHVHAVGGNLPTAAQKVRVCTPPSDSSCNRVPWSFTNLDYLVSDAKTAGAEPLMNIALPPPWQWTITDPTSEPTPTARVTDANDPQQPFAMFASYMRSLVEYYNRGSTTVSEADGTSHTIVNPRGTANRIVWWELLNEPSITSPANPYQPPGPYPLTPTFTPQQYVSLWNATTAAMLEADPTVKVVGPALPFVLPPAGSAASSDYIPLLLQQSHRPDAISFHAYAWADNEVTDAIAYSGDPTHGSHKGLSGVFADLHQVQAWTKAAGVPALPIWIDEFGFNGFGATDPHMRPTHAFAVAYTAAAFGLLSSEPAVTQVDEFSFLLQSYPDLSLLDVSPARQPVLLYWLYRAIGQAFPTGATVLPVAQKTFSLSAPGVAAFAVRLADSTRVNVVLANATVASPGDKGGPGVPTTVTLQVNHGSFAHVTVQAIDAATSLDVGPVATAQAAGNRVSVTLPGYGVAVLQFAP